MVDGADSQVALRARFAFATRPVPTPGQVEPRITVLYNPNLRTATFMIPGLIGFILQLVLISLTSGSIVREREQGSLEQLMVSPVGKLGLMLGKLAPFLILAIVEMLGIVAFGWLMFDVHVVGNLLLLIAMSLPFIFAALALGLVISTAAQNQNQAQQMSFMVIMPSILMSGFIFPRETMPGFLYVISNILPLTHELVILRGIAVRGANFMELLQPFAILCGISAVLVFLATRKFQKSMG
jgi:ABC-2 type transport system permease protein